MCRGRVGQKRLAVAGGSEVGAAGGGGAGRGSKAGRFLLERRGLQEPIGGARLSPAIDAILERMSKKECEAFGL